MVIAHTFILFCAKAQTVTHQVYFEHDSFTIQPEYGTLLKAFADSIKNFSIEKIEVTGWCDDTGTNAYNMVLSLNRAQAVAAFFDTPALWVEGKGELPAESRLNKATARQKNRRVTSCLSYYNPCFTSKYRSS